MPFIRKNRKVISGALFCLFWLLSLGAYKNASAPPKALYIGQEALEMGVWVSEESWLMACQEPNGAIKQTPYADEVIPYFANAAAYALVDIDPLKAKNYMSWYLSNINLPDRWGIYGTIYDQKVAGDFFVPTKDYDSADSYASTFLTLVSHYCQKTGDGSFYFDNMESWTKVASVLLDLQDKDGLIFAKPNSRAKYLMDNAENYRGLEDWAYLLAELGKKEESQAFFEAASKVKDGIKNKLANPKDGSYAWVASWYGKAYPKPGIWYPDAMSQLSLISNGVFTPESAQGAMIWDKFKGQFPRWQEGVTGDTFPWVSVALVAQSMGEEESVESFMDWVSAHFQENLRSYPWHIQESSYVCRLEKSAPLGVLEQKKADDARCTPSH